MSPGTTQAGGASRGKSAAKGVTVVTDQDFRMIAFAPETTTDVMYIKRHGILLSRPVEPFGQEDR